MKKLQLILLCISSLLISCNQQKQTVVQDELTPVEKIAQAYGIDHFSNMWQIEYTFNVQRDTIKSGRSWKWKPETGSIVSISNGDTIAYNQGEVTDSLKKVDHRFINDKYWLLFPFQLVWDTDMTYKLTEKDTAPISGEEMAHLVITYGDKGGYTPGDVYELYLDENWLIKEWIFRKGGSEKPSLITTWENHQDFDGLKIATDHHTKDGGFRLWFSDIKCTPKG